MGDYGPSHADLNPSTYPNHATTVPSGPDAPAPGEGKTEQDPTDPSESGLLSGGAEVNPDVEDQHVTLQASDLSPAEQKALQEKDSPPLAESVGGEDGRAPAPESEEQEGNGVYLATSQVPGESAPEGEDEQQTTTEASSSDGYDDMTKADLQDELDRKGLPTSGNKADLIERLRSA